MNMRARKRPLFGMTGLVYVQGVGGASYRLAHQASMITSWAMPGSMV